MSALPPPLLSGGAPAIAAAVGFVGIAVFQIALAAGAPLGHAAWGGSHDAAEAGGERGGDAGWVRGHLVVRRARSLR